MWASMRARSRAVSAASIAAERLGYAWAAINASSCASMVSGTVAVTLTWVRAMGFIPPEQQNRSKHGKYMVKDHIKNKGTKERKAMSRGVTRLRPITWRDALVLRILCRCCLHFCIGVNSAPCFKSISTCPYPMKALHTQWVRIHTSGIVGEAGCVHRIV